MKLVETVYTGYDWNSGESDVDRRVEVALVDKDGKSILSVGIQEGEPEDMVLWRNLADVYTIADLVWEAYELGRKGIELERVSQELKIE